MTLKDRSFSVMGHSWGGFSTMNIGALHPESTHVVSMSGFVSVEKILEQTFAGLLKPFRKAVLKVEQQVNPDYVNFNAAESLKKTPAKVLLIYSTDDSVVKKEIHCDTLMAELSGEGNVRFHLVHGKDHNPTYTTEAVKYKNAFFAQLQKLRKQKKPMVPEERKKFMDSFDWYRMTEQDEAVWSLIRKFLMDE